MSSIVFAIQEKAEQLSPEKQSAALDYSEFFFKQRKAAAASSDDF